MSQMEPFCAALGRSRKNTPSNLSARANSGGSREISFAGADDEHVRAMVCKPRQERAEEPG